MKEIKIYEEGEEVYIKAVVRNIVVDNGVIKYTIRNKSTGIDEKCLYTQDQIIPITKEVKEKPKQKTTAQKETKTE